MIHDAAGVDGYTLGTDLNILEQCKHLISLVLFGTCLVNSLTRLAVDTIDSLTLLAV